MAQLTNSTRTAVRPYRSRFAGSPPIWHLQESTLVAAASSNAIKYGDVVQFDVNVATANHRIVRASTMANQPNVVSTALVGIAAETPATSTQSADAPGAKMAVYLATPGTEFLFPTKAAGTAHLSSLVGSRRAIGYDSTDSFFYCDIGNSTAGDATLIITEVIDPGTTNGLVAAKFLSTNTARFVSAAF
jgi:hypothetical protein